MVGLRLKAVLLAKNSIKGWKMLDIDPFFMNKSLPIPIKLYTTQLLATTQQSMANCQTLW
jgi:hypothetical protein